MPNCAKRKSVFCSLLNIGNIVSGYKKYKTCHFCGHNKARPALAQPTLTNDGKVGGRGAGSLMCVPAQLAILVFSFLTTHVNS